jgi:hypothetical protein
MSKKKSKRIEKETRKIIESISDLVKYKNDGYKFKAGKKKQIREIKKTCAHWVIRKGKEVPTVSVDPENPNNWKCRICGKSFPIKPLSYEDYEAICNQFEAAVNQGFFYSVKMGGAAEDTKVFLSMKKMVPRFKKIIKNEIKNLNKRQEYEDRKANSDTMSQFGNYSSYSYK